MPTPPHVPPMIRTDASNAFAHHTLRVRLPATFRQTRDSNPDYPAAIRDALTALADSLADDRPIPPLELPAPDYDEWTAAWEAHQGHTWLNTDWWFAETYAYRLLIQAVRWWETGRDPFAPTKQEELQGDSLRALTGRTLAIDGPVEERLRALIHHALWGNRIDLSYAPALAHGLTVSDEHLLLDDSAPVVEHLLRSRGTVHLIADNFGTELAVDFVLIDALLDGVADAAMVHLKLHPTFVSDATGSDALALIHSLESSPHDPSIRRLGQRLRAALEEGRLRLAPDLYWNSSRLLWDLPPRLARLFADARLVIIKGDANYRRMAGDAIWPPAISFKAGLSYFPAPLVTLRTLKGDTLLGLPAERIAQLDAQDPEWRTNGQRGLIQSTLA